MHEILMDRLAAYIRDHHPDLLAILRADFSVTAYLEEKVQGVMPLAEQLLAEEKPFYVVEELCLRDLTGDLGVSRFDYIKRLLEEEFLQTYHQLSIAGVLTYELINLVGACEGTFDRVGFSERHETDRELYYEITGIIQEYLDGSIRL